MARLLIVHHTPSPALHAMLLAVREGAQQPDLHPLEVTVEPALGATAADCLAADGYLLGSPVNLGYLSGALKHFFDQVYYPCLDATRSRPFGFWLHGDNDAGGAVRAMEAITTGLGWKQVATPVVVSGPTGVEALAACRELGATVGARVLLDG